MHHLLTLVVARTAAALCLAAASFCAHADTFSRTESGGFLFDNTVQSFEFDLLGLSDLRLWTTSFAAGQGDPVLALFDRQSGALLSLSDDVDAPYPQVDASQGVLDAGMHIHDLAAGQYRVAVSLSPNLPAGSTWAMGYNLDGQTGKPMDTGWTVRLEVTPAAPVPEPGPAALLLAGMAMLGWMTRRRYS